MSASRHGIASLCLLVVSISAPAEEKRPVPRDRSTEVTAVFRDGSVLKGVTLSGSVELTTRYGKLTVPLADVQRVEFGSRAAATESRKIEQAVARLRSEKEEERAEARRQLAGLGPKAVAALEGASRDGDDAFACRAQAVLHEIRKAVPADQLQARTHDVLVTSEGTFAGRLGADTLKATTKTLGEVQFKITDLRSLHGPGDAPDQPAAGSAPVRDGPSKATEHPPESR